MTELVSSVVDFSRMPIHLRWFDKGVYRVCDGVSVALIGHNEVATRCDCGKVYPIGCTNVEGHRRRELDGSVHVDEGIGMLVPHHCHNAGCPVCSLDWVKRMAKEGEKRLLKASEMLDLPVEHVSISVPHKYWGLSENEVLKLAREALKRRGFLGGNEVYHPARFRNKRPYYAPHLHSLTFLKGGYTCRDCKFCKLNRYLKRYYCNFGKECCGFLQLTRKCNEKDGFIVEIAKERGTLKQDRRRSVYSTLAYELGHCGYQLGGKRVRPFVWWGFCSERKLVLPKEEKKRCDCPVCGEKFKTLKYVGDDEKMLTYLHSPEGLEERLYKLFTFRVHDDGGRLLWQNVVYVKKRHFGDGNPFVNDGNPFG